MPDISVSIVSYNTRDLLHCCLQSLRERAAAENLALQIIVADNASVDGSLQMVQRDFPEVHAFSMGGNTGFGRANNAALERAAGRYYLLLNPDAEVEPGALTLLMRWLEEHPQCAAVGGQLITPHGSLQPSCSQDPDLLAIVAEQTGLYKLFPRSRIAGVHQAADATNVEPREVEQICGACFMVRREAWHRVGGFDPAYFMYFEDVDLCIRLRANGENIAFVPQARARHQLGASSESDWRTRARMIAAHNWSRYYFFGKAGKMAGLSIKGILIAGALLRALGWGLRALGNPSLRTKTKLFREVLRQTSRMSLSRKLDSK